MELKDFIKTTLRELSEAIDESGTELDRKVMLTNTTLRVKDHGEYGLIDFDLAVEASESHNTGATGGTAIKVIEANLAKHDEIVSSTASRIKFTVEANFDSFNAPKPK